MSDKMTDLESGYEVETSFASTMRTIVLYLVSSRLGRSCPAYGPPRWNLWESHARVHRRESHAREIPR